MAAHLYPGIKSLHLVLDTPYDLIRTDDIRDDIIGVKVWYSTTSGFNPASGQGTLAFDGLSLSITIPNLETNTRYYVRYAFISAIDPTTYTISAELTEQVYDENVKVYGYLTNDPTGIATESDGSGGDFSLATGTFKVYNLSQDVTGNGVVYSIKPNSTYYIQGATINPVTGVYSCTGMTENSGSVTFLATYDGIVVEQVWNVYRGIAGASAPLIKLVATSTDFVYKDQYATTAETPQTSITASLINLTGTPIFQSNAYARNGTLLGPIQFTQLGNTVTMTQAQFGQYGNTTGTVLVTATIGTVYDTVVLYRINDGTEQITVELSNFAHTIPAANNGDTLPANYVGSGTSIRVKQGNQYLPVDSTSPYDSLGTWNIFEINSVNITCDPTPLIGTDSIVFDAHAAMTADQAYIDYTIMYRTTTGFTGSQTVRQSFSKSKEGVVGASAPAVNLVAPRLAFVTPKNGGTTWPDSITLTANISNIENPVFTWKINDVVQPGQTTSSLVVPKFSNVGSKTYTVQVSGTSNVGEPVSIYDIITLYHVSEGSDAITVAIDNENQVISCDSTGTPVAGQFPITRNTIVVRGSEVLTSGVTYAKVSETGMSSSISSNGIITITGISQLFASATYTFTVGSVTITKLVKLSKSIEGASAPVVSVTATDQAFITLKNGCGYNKPNIVLTAEQINILNPTYKWYVDNVLQSGQTASSFTISAFPAGSSKLVKCVVNGTNATDIYDVISIFSLQEGSDSLAAGLTNENQTLTADPYGNIYGGQLPLTSQMVVVRGTEVLSSGVTYSVVSQSGLTATINSAGAISVTAFSAAQIGSATFRATVGTTSLDKVLTVTKTKDGAQGQPGTSIQGDPGYQGIAARVVYLKLAQDASAPATPANTTGSTTVPSGWSGTAPTAGVGEVIWYSYGSYNPNNITYQGIPANTTVWNTPIATSVFQDIKSDNWAYQDASGVWQYGIPDPNAYILLNRQATGYYLQKSGTYKGTIYANTAFFKGNVAAIGVGTAFQANVTIQALQYYGYPSFVAAGTQNLPSNLAGNLRVGAFTYSEQSDNASWNVGLLSQATGAGGSGNPSGNIGGYKGIAIVATGDAVGVYAETKAYNSSAVAIMAKAPAGIAGQFEGPVKIIGQLDVTGNILATGNVTAYNTSDKRFKTNISKIENPLQKLRNIGGYTYDWTPEYLLKLGKYDPELVKEHDVGVIAQEVLSQIPQAVARRKDGTLAVNYEKLVPLLIEAILELDRKIR